MGDSTGIKIENQNDYSIKTTPMLSVNMDNIKVDRDIDPIDKRSEKDKETDDFQFLADPKKMQKKVPESTALPIDNPIRNPLDTDTGISHSHIINGGGDYKPRYVNNNVSNGNEPSEIMNTIGKLANNSGFFESVKSSIMTEDDIRREKSFLLHQYETKNGNSRYSPKILTMNNSLDEIKNELEYINSKRDLENNMGTWKEGMFLFLNSAVQLNNVYDPFDVDLSNWLRDTHYDLMKKGKYDEVLEKLIIKWRGKMPISPELQLMGMLGMSLAGGIMAQKQEKKDKARRLKEEKLMEERVQNTVQAELRKMQKQFRSAHYDQVSPKATDSTKLNGPDEELLEIIKADFIDSTIAETESVLQTNNDEPSEYQEHIEHFEQPVSEIPKKRKGGRPAGSKNTTPRKSKSKKQEDSANVMTVSF